MPKQGCPPIQAADLFVYEANKELLREMELPGAPPKKRYPMERLEKTECVRSYMLEDTMRKMSRAIDAGTAEAKINLLFSGKRVEQVSVTFGQEPKSFSRILKEALEKYPPQ